MGRLSLSDRQERHSLYVLYSIVGDPIYKDSMTCVTNDFLSVYRCPVFHTVICTDTSVNIREKQNAFGVLVTQDILHTCSIYIILAKLVCSTVGLVLYYGRPFVPPDRME